MRQLALLLGAVALAAAQVSVREEKSVIPTWEIGPPQVHSNFWDGGRQQVYPYTLNDILTDRKVDKTYHAVFLENEYIRVLVLPEIGGRLHGALDKTNGYVWMYWQKTIKPGLISMTGAWISGGIEWNFPHGHRPSCYMKVDHRVVRHADGSATVWVGETEPIYRMRWLVGMTIYPGRSYIRCDYVFINPTDHRHSFQFWATAATHANEYTQAQYPGDMVTGHGKHQFWNWPIHNGVDLTWWKNSPNASSYFAFNNPADWFGAYDHRAQGGTVHVANHHLMPGKKLWTWGSGPSGRIWEDILTEGGGPYFEPQAGAFSDNQPDHHWLNPHEVRRAHDYWYPVRDTRGFNLADQDFALNTDLKDGKAFGAVYSTGVVKQHRVVLRDAARKRVLAEQTVSISPDKPFTVEVAVPREVTLYDLQLAVYEPDGRLRLELQRPPPLKVELPPGQRDPGDPKKMSQDELYHAGEWLDRFVRTPEALAYYEEALRRDPKDSRVNAEMGFLELKQGRWQEGLKRLDLALERDYDNARLHFGRGVAEAALGRYEEAYDNFQRATWSSDWSGPAYFNLARLELRQGRWLAAIGKLGEAASRNGEFADIPALEAAAWRRAGDPKKALAAAERALALDAMHFMGGYEKSLARAEFEKEWAAVMRGEPQNYLELVTAYGAAGLYADVETLLGRAPAHTMNGYLRAYFQGLAGNEAAARRFYAEAAQGGVNWVNPHRLEEMAALEAALRHNGRDARAHLFLGNLLYSKHRREEALSHWQQAASIDPALWQAWRNVAYAQRYLQKDLPAARQTYQKALAVNPQDARALLELDQVSEALRLPPAERLAVMSQHLDTVRQRDDLMARLADLRLKAGDPENLKLAHQSLRTHHFHSWEGRYGIHESWVEVNQRLGDLAYERRDYAAALDHYQQACEYPKNLEVAPRTPDLRAHVYWNLAKVHLAAGRKDAAADYLDKILAEKYGRAHLGSFYQALAEKARGNEARYGALLEQLAQRARELTSGKFEYRGNQQAVGHYLLARVLEERGAAEAAAEREKALALSLEAPRLALREAQLDYARAHQ
ncbi:MAG: DUF5107 domain-containing protein [Acidobacteria bacterium]|nr:DUF5107 domain-containing protein [Acidobacteriota bacterium]